MIFFPLIFWCLDYMLVDEQNALCVRKCPENYYPVNNTCVPCDGACPKCKSVWDRYRANQPRRIDGISTVLHLSLENVTLVSWRCQSRALAEVSRLRHARQYKLSASSIWAVKFLHYANTYCDMPLLLQFLKKIHDFNFSCEAVQPMALWRTFIL